MYGFTLWLWCMVNGARCTVHGARGYLVPYEAMDAYATCHCAFHFVPFYTKIMRLLQYKKSFNIFVQKYSISSFKSRKRNLRIWKKN